MPNMNVVVLAGHMTRDPELMRVGSENTPLCKFGLAVSRKYKDKEEVCFVDCEMWGTRAETLSHFLRKGSPIIVQGELRLDQWDDRETGQKRSKHKIRVENFSFAGKKPDGDGDEPSVPMKSGGRRKPAGPTDTKYGEPIDESQIPF